jgi:hypothetical protein
MLIHTHKLRVGVAYLASDFAAPVGRRVDLSHPTHAIRSKHPRTPLPVPNSLFACLRHATLIMPRCLRVKTSHILHTIQHIKGNLRYCLVLTNLIHSIPFSPSHPPFPCIWGKSEAVYMTVHITHPHTHPKPIHPLSTQPPNSGLHQKQGKLKVESSLSPSGGPFMVKQKMGKTKESS